MLTLGILAFSLGAAVAAPAALSLITVTFPEGKQRTRALGARYALPESQRYPRRWDLPGAVTGPGGFALLIYGLTRAATGPDGISHWGDPATIITLACAAAALGVFMLIEARSAQPLLPLWIFADRNRAGVYLILLCLASVFFGMFFFPTLFTQVVWGYSALRGGLAYLPFIGGFIVLAGICTRLVPRLGARGDSLQHVQRRPASRRGGGPGRHRHGGLDHRQQPRQARNGDRSTSPGPLMTTTHANFP